jgi:hypothetical protein
VSGPVDPRDQFGPDPVPAGGGDWWRTDDDERSDDERGDGAFDGAFDDVSVDGSDGSGRPGASAEPDPFDGFDAPDPAFDDPGDGDPADDGSTGGDPGDPGDGPGAGRVPPPGAGRAARIVTVAVLAALLAGAVVLDRRSPTADPARVTTPGLAGPEVPGDDAVSVAWYCPAGTAVAGGATEETVYIANLSPGTITADVTVDAASTESTTERVEVGAYGRRAVRVATVARVGAPGVVVEVVGGAAVVEHEIRGADDLAMSPCARTASRRWYFAAGGTARGAAQVLELFNPFGDDAIVDVGFVTDSGVQEPQALQGIVVGRRAKVVVPVTDVVPRQERVATVVRARTGRIVAEQVRSFAGADGVNGLTLSLGTPTPRREWILPLPVAASGVVGAVAIANFGLVPATAEVSVLLSGGGSLAPETVDVPTRSVVRFDPSARIPVGTTAAVVVRVPDGGRVVAESVVTSGGGAATDGGAAVAARRWALAGAPAGAPTGAFSAVVAVNPGPGPVTVEVLAYRAGDPVGPRSAPAQVVPPGRVARFDLAEWGIAPGQVLVVSADGPIVVGRDTYLGAVSLATAVPFRD